MATTTHMPRRLAQKGRAHAQPYEKARARRSHAKSASPERDNEPDETPLSSPSKDENAASGGLFKRLMGVFPSADKTERVLNTTEEVETSDEDRPEAELDDEPPFKHTRHAEAEAKARHHHQEEEGEEESGKNSATEMDTTHPDPETQKTETPKPKNPKRRTPKSLRIDRAEPQQNAMVVARGHRRSRSPTTESTDALLHVLKRQKSITLAEYERLTSQLRRLVEPTPENALALTRQTLTSALAPRPLSEHGQQPKRWHSPEENDALHPGKMSRREEQPQHMMLPMAMPMPMPVTMPSRMHRKPRPSRLLTGANRNSAQRSAYSAAVAEKVLSRLNKVPSPLEREAIKPAPSTTLSWAKYQLAAIRDQTPDTSAVESKTEDEAMPPRATLPTIALQSKPQPKAQPVIPTKVDAPVFSFGAPQSIPKPVETPAPKPKFGNSTPLFTPPEVSTTPAFSAPVVPVVKKSPAVAMEKAGIQVSKEVSSPKKQSMGEYAFTLPTPTTTRVHDETKMQYVFSPPPSLREPPKRATETKSSPAMSTATPFSFMPASPKLRPESLTKSNVPTKKSPGAALRKEVEKPRTASAAAPSLVSSDAAVNPLARFMTPAPGTWKCPSCSVTNKDDQLKCPCCETARPSANNAPAAASAPAVAPASSGVNPLARFATPAPGTWKCPSCSVTNKDEQAKCPCCETAKPGGASEPAITKPTEKPAAGSIGPGGFTFKSASSSAAASSSGSGGFTFGSTSQSNASSATEAKSTAAPTFSFGVSSSSAESTKPAPAEAKPSFSFGVVASATDKPKQETPAFSFGAKPSGGEEKKEPASVSTGMFTFNQKPSASETASTAEPKAETKAETTSTTPAFSFGVAPSNKPKTADSLDVHEQTKPAEDTSSTPASGFGGFSSSSPSFGASSGGFTFGLPPKAKQPEATSSLNNDSSPITKAPAVSTTVQTEGKKAVATPSFTFGSSTPATPVAPAATAAAPALESAMSIDDDIKNSAQPTVHSFSFTAPESSTPFGMQATQTAEQTPVAKPTFSFGASSPKPVTGADATATSKPSFTFGQTAPAANPSFTFGATATTDGAASTAAASSTPAVKTAGATFTFGGAAQPAATTFGSSSFGSAPTGNQTTGFGTSTSTSFGTSTTSPAFGATPAEPAKPTFAFGESAQPAQTAQPAFPFGGSAQTSTGFGASTATGFGAAPTNTFGATSAGTGFGSTPAPAFGSQTTPAPAFGSTAPTNGNVFGASSAAPAFGGISAPGASMGSGGFGASTSTAPTAFGAAAPAAPAFGVPTPAFPQSVSPAFGAPGRAPSPSFGAPADRTSSPAFGAPAATAFGSAPATPSFGPPNPAFGGPAPGFGNQMAGNPMTGNPAAGGFTMGAAPANTRGRRILRARPRPRRQ